MNPCCLLWSSCLCLCWIGDVATSSWEIGPIALGPIESESGPSGMYDEECCFVAEPIAGCDSIHGRSWPGWNAEFLSTSDECTWDSELLFCCSGCRKHNARETTARTLPSPLVLHVELLPKKYDLWNDVLPTLKKYSSTPLRSDTEASFCASTNGALPGLSISGHAFE